MPHRTLSSEDWIISEGGKVSREDRRGAFTTVIDAIDWLQQFPPDHFVTCSLGDLIVIDVEPDAPPATRAP